MFGHTKGLVVSFSELMEKVNYLGKLESFQKIALKLVKTLKVFRKGVTNAISFMQIRLYK